MAFNAPPTPPPPPPPPPTHTHAHLHAHAHTSTHIHVVVISSRQSSMSMTCMGERWFHLLDENIFIGSYIGNPLPHPLSPPPILRFVILINAYTHTHTHTHIHTHMHTYTHTHTLTHTHIHTHIHTHTHTQVSLEGDDMNGLSTVSEDLEKAIKLAPNCPFALYSLASTYHRIAGIHQSMQLLESARIKFEDAVRKFPNFVDGLILYSMVSIY